METRRKKVDYPAVNSGRSASPDDVIAGPSGAANSETDSGHAITKTLSKKPSELEFQGSDQELFQFLGGFGTREHAPFSFRPIEPWGFNPSRSNSDGKISLKPQNYKINSISYQGGPCRQVKTQSQRLVITVLQGIRA